MKKLFWCLSACTLASMLCTTTSAQLPDIKTSDNKRFLQTSDGKPFFWLGDTAWELFHRLNREEATKYLDQRASNGFNIVQAVAVAELNGPGDPNAYGHLPFQDFDASKPAIVDGPDNDYWDHVDWIVNEANKRGIYVGFLPTWGAYWHEPTHDGKVIFTPQNAKAYGKWIGTRYKDKGVIWILGGDRTIENDDQRKTIALMAEGLREGDGGKHLITFHPRGGRGSADDFHNEAWLDFNMRQNGHSIEFTHNFANTRKDYNREPVKPVLDGEPIYEDHPLSFKPKDLGHSVAADVRRPFYWDVFTGAFGHTYGHHSVWQMYSEKRNPINNPLMTWSQAIDQPGALQLQHGKKLILSRPYFDRIPADDVVVQSNIPTAMPGAGSRYFAATRDQAGTYAFIYCPVGRPVTVNMAAIKGAKINAWWFDPRSGKADKIGDYSNSGKQTFQTPTPGELLDWVLVLDDASKNYPTPGQ